MPITVVWLTTAEKLSILKNVFVAIEKNAIAISSASRRTERWVASEHHARVVRFQRITESALVSVAIPPSLQ